MKNLLPLFLILFFTGCSTTNLKTPLAAEHDKLLTKIKLATTASELELISLEAKSLRKLILSEIDSEKEKETVEVMKGEAFLAEADRQKALRDYRILEIQVAKDKVELIDKCASIDETPQQIEDRLCLITELSLKVYPDSLEDLLLGTKEESDSFKKAVEEAEIRLKGLQKTGHLYRKPPRFVYNK